MSSIPLSSETNVFVHFYTDWVDHLFACFAFYTFTCTPAVFFIGMCLYISGLKEDLRTAVAASDRITTDRFIDAILFHNKIIGYFDWEFSNIALSIETYHFICLTISLANGVGEIMSVGLFFQLLVCAASIAVYMVGMEKSVPFSMGFFLGLCGFVTVITTTYVYCFLSENVSSDLEAIGDGFYDYEWYQLSARQQQLFGLTIQRAQKAFRMNGLGLVECSLRVYASVSLLPLIPNTF